MSLIKSCPREGLKALDAAAGKAMNRVCQPKILKYRFCLLQDELDLLQQPESTCCDAEAVSREGMIAKLSVTKLVERLHRGTTVLQDRLRSNLDLLLVAVTSRLKKVSIERRWIFGGVLFTPFAALLKIFSNRPSVPMRLLIEA